MFMCGFILTIFGFSDSVSMCSLQLGVRFKECLVIPDSFICTLCSFCISLSKPALVGQIGTGRPALFEKLQTLNFHMLQVIPENWSNSSVFNVLWK